MHRVTMSIPSDPTFERIVRASAGELGDTLGFEPERIEDLSQEATVFAYFNNDWEVFAPRNARRLQQLLHADRRLPSGR